MSQPLLSEGGSEGLFVDLVTQNREVHETTAVVDEMMATVEALMDVDAFNNPINEPTPQTRELIRITASNLLSTDATPALESNGGLGQVIRNLFKRIVEALKGLIRKLQKFWQTVGDSNAYLRMTLDRLKQRAEARMGLSETKRTIDIGRRAMRLMVKGKPLSASTEYLKAFNELNRQLKVVADRHIPAVADVGEHFVRVANGNKSDSRKFLKQMLEAAPLLNLAKTASALNAIPHQDARFARNEMLAAPGLLNNKMLFVRKNPLNAGSRTLVGQADGIRSIGLYLMNATVESSNLITKHEIRPLEPRVVIELVDQMLELMDEIDKFLGSSLRNRISKSYESLIKATEAIKKWTESSTHSEASLREYAAAMRFATTYARWSESPHDELIVTAVTAVRTMAEVCRMSLSAYR